MSRLPPPRRHRVALCVAGALALALAGCSGGDESDAGQPPPDEPTPSSVAVADLDVPDGIELTDPGAELEIGDDAVVAWQPRADQTGVVRLRVRDVEQVGLGAFTAFSSANLSDSTPYFVRVRVENVGETPLGGRSIPLYLLDATDTLVERSVFGSTFEACPSEPLPAGFTPGEVVRTCLVFLAPRRGSAEAISFRPTEDFSPITWTGEISVPRGDRGR